MCFPFIISFKWIHYKYLKICWCEWCVFLDIWSECRQLLFFFCCCVMLLLLLHLNGPINHFRNINIKRAKYNFKNVHSHAAAAAAQYNDIHWHTYTQTHAHTLKNCHASYCTEHMKFDWEQKFPHQWPISR